MSDSERLMMTVIIADRPQKDGIIKALLDRGVHIIETMYGHGTAHIGYIGHMLGLSQAKPKVVILSFEKKAKASEVLEMLLTDFHFGQPHTGIAFTVPIEKMVF
ncbi:MAG: hypothetical protein LBI54_02270 [Lachnospiraceae bacterium]|jgi:hypothetical protein|nr:hypothetical protein [Lachnospiraceae bacterium]